MLIHPECTPDTLALADYIGSTSGIIDFATESSEKEFIICTEDGVMYELQRKNPDKTFYMVHDEFQCPGMKQITLDKVLDVLENKTNQINVDDKLRADSLAPLQKMLELGK